MTALTKVDLRAIFLRLQEQMIAALTTNRGLLHHPTTQGTATELHWLKMLNDYLPKRYSVENAFVLDCDGQRSDQIDIVIFDRQYSPFLFNQDGAKFVPAESVYGVIEVKPRLDAANIAYAGEKAASVRALRRTSTSIPHAGGEFEPKKPTEILAGIVALDSGWNPPLGDAFASSIRDLTDQKRLDFGCVLRSGGFDVRHIAGGGINAEIRISPAETALVFFFLRLLAKLQACGTVVAIGLDEYEKAL